MNFTERDKDMLRKIATYGVLSTHQIAQMFFPGVAGATVRRRLRALEEANHIYRVPGLDHGGVAWTLSRKTSFYFGREYSGRRFNRATIEHDVCVNDVRHALESAGLAQSWIPEHVLKAKSYAQSRTAQVDRNVPDALFSMRVGGEPKAFALELELSAKKNRYRKVFESYSRMKKLWCVWYIVDDSKIGELITNVGSEYYSGQDDKLLVWTHFLDLIKNPREADVHSKNQTWTLEEILFPPAPAGAPSRSRLELSKVTGPDSLRSENHS